MCRCNRAVAIAGGCARAIKSETRKENVRSLLRFAGVVTVVRKRMASDPNYILCSKSGTQHYAHWIEYRPSQAERTAKTRLMFDAIGRRIRDEGATPELLRELDACRPKKCRKCRIVQKLCDVKPTTLKGRTRAYWHEISTGDCPRCGKQNVPIEWQHERGEFVHSLGDHAFWAVNGGVEAMQAEQSKCDPMCRNCSLMRPQHAKFRRKYTTLHDMPQDTEAQKQAFRDRRICDEKYDYVDRIKCGIGSCAECGLRAQQGRLHVLAFAHKDAAELTDHISEMCRSRRKLESARKEIDEEIAKCRLLCQTCHQIETRERNGNQEVNALFPETRVEDL